jgi:hypothetical protein
MGKILSTRVRNANKKFAPLQVFVKKVPPPPVPKMTAAPPRHAKPCLPAELNNFDFENAVLPCAA